MIKIDSENTIIMSNSGITTMLYKSTVDPFEEFLETAALKNFSRLLCLVEL